MRLLWRLTLCATLALLAYAAVYEPQQVTAVVHAVGARLQAALPLGAPGSSDRAVAEGYGLLQENSMVSLYGAVAAFAQAAAAQEHDVCARAGQADAQLALAHAYGTSAQLMAAHVKSLHGPSRRAADRLVREERGRSQEHLRAGLQFAKEAVRLSPIAFAAHRSMAGALLQAGRFERARPYLAQASAARPNDVEVRVLLAQQKAAKDADAAIGFFTSLLAALPQHNGARLRLALLRWRHNDRAGARQDALTILASSPGHALAHRLLVELEPMAGAAGSASMSRLLPLPTEAEVAPLLPPKARLGSGPAPSASSPWPTARATIYLWLQRGAHAASRGYGLCVAYGGPLAHAARDAVMGLMASASAEGPQPAQTLPTGGPGAVATAQADGPGDLESLVGQAKAQQQRRERGQAEKTWQRALAVAPGNVEVLVALGWCRLQAHDAVEAQRLFARAVAAAPGRAEAHFGMAEAKRMAHDRPGALTSYQRYLALEPHGPLAPLCHQMLEELSPEG